MFSRSMTFIAVAAFVVASAAVARAGYQQDVLDLGPLDYWQLEETSTSSSAIDSASDGSPDGSYGSASDPTLAGPTEPGFDSGNSAAGFVDDNSNSHVNMGTYAPVTGDDARTVLAWVKPNLGLAGDSDGGKRTILAYGNNNTGERFRFQIADSSSDGSSDTADDLGLDVNGAVRRSTTGPVSDGGVGGWQFVAIVFPNANTTLSDIQLFHNGDQLTNLETFRTATINTGSGMPFKIGQHDGNSNFNFDGGIDEVAVFDKKLTGTQIGDLYNAAVIPEPASLALLAPAGLLMLRRRRR